MNYIGFEYIYVPFLGIFSYIAFFAVREKKRIFVGCKDAIRL